MKKSAKSVLIQGECIEKMSELPDQSIDLVLTDPPYGTTSCKWDSIIPLVEMWDQIRRLVKSNSAIVLTASQPFTTTLIASNVDMFKYCWVWDKGRGYNFASLKYQPFKSHEDICVFSKKAHRYYPQKTKGKPYRQKQGRKGEVYGGCNGKEIITENKGDRYPLSIQRFVRGRDTGQHPTQKPVSLMEYLVKTYSKENDTVLDFTMGSGTTGFACKNMGRNFIGIELDKDYFETAKKRIESTI